VLFVVDKMALVPFSASTPVTLANHYSDFSAFNTTHHTGLVQQAK
jgi:hypothetical protein